MLLLPTIALSVAATFTGPTATLNQTICAASQPPNELPPVAVTTCANQADDIVPEMLTDQLTPDEELRAPSPPPADAQQDDRRPLDSGF